MANLIEYENWEDGIYQLEKRDQVLGGSTGVSNTQAKQLANRTRYLKKLLESLGVTVADLNFYTQAEANGLFAARASNLADLADKGTARTNIGLGTMATQNSNGVSITGGTAVLSTVTATGNIKGIGVFDNDNRVYSSINPPPYPAAPVRSVNGLTGDIITATALLGSRGWHKDLATGKIKQWGVVIRTGFTTQVSFPITFPNDCVGVQLTLNTTIYDLKDSTDNIRASAPDKYGFIYNASGDAEISAYWEANGY